jgi:UDP-3-O-[3-hydroxymyristoyl] glucosamine N-acyltransferase
MSQNLQQLAKTLKLAWRGEAGLEITGVASPRSARPGDLCFILHRKFLDEITESECSAVILTEELAAEVADKALLLSDNPHYSFVQAIRSMGLDATGRVEASIHPSAQIAASARLGDEVSIGANVVIGDDVEIGSDSFVGAGSVLENAVSLGSQCYLHPRVSLAHGVTLGQRCLLHSGVVIGSDGFGLVMHAQRWEKIPQLGSVIIGDDVEIGANTTIDRGALDNTVIESGCKLDNQIQVAHNVHIGAHTAIAACVGIAGSATIGRHCKISGAAVVLGHLEVVDNVTITAMSLVTKDIRKPGVYSSGTPLLENSVWHRNNARYKSLDKIAQTVARLEKSVKPDSD